MGTQAVCLGEGLTAAFRGVLRAARDSAWPTATATSTVRPTAPTNTLHHLPYPRRFRGPRPLHRRCRMLGGRRCSLRPARPHAAPRRMVARLRQRLGRLWRGAAAPARPSVAPLLLKTTRQFGQLKTMPVTININKLSLCHKASGGMSIATIPDVCKTPTPGGPVPIPYPNIATEQALAKGTTTVKADGGNIARTTVRSSARARETKRAPGAVSNPVHSSKKQPGLPSRLT